MIQGYPWPASAITVEDMALLHQVRESLSPKVPITRLIAQAVRTIYMNITPTPYAAQATNTKQKEAA